MGLGQSGRLQHRVGIYPHVVADRLVPGYRLYLEIVRYLQFGCSANLSLFPVAGALPRRQPVTAVASFVSLAESLASQIFFRELVPWILIVEGGPVCVIDRYLGDVVVEMFVEIFEHQIAFISPVYQQTRPVRYLRLAFILHLQISG